MARRADVSLVYIAEAHARDEWPVGNPLRVARPTTTAARCAVSRRMLREAPAAAEAAAAGVRLYVDGAQEDGFDEAFRAWPTRFYALKHGLVRLESRPRARGCSLDRRLRTGHCCSLDRRLRQRLANLPVYGRHVDRRSALYDKRSALYDRRSALYDRRSALYDRRSALYALKDGLVRLYARERRAARLTVNDRASAGVVSRRPAIRLCICT